MKYSDAVSSLIPNAPSGVGGICPICGGQLDGITWACVSNGKEHDERCKKCCTLISLDIKGKPTTNYSKDKDNYDRFLEKKKTSLMATRREIIDLNREKTNMGFFHKLTNGLFNNNREDIIDIEIREAEFDEEMNSFSRFKEY